MSGTRDKQWNAGNFTQYMSDMYLVLDQLDREEMWDLCRRLRPDMPREQFEADWAAFLALKARKALQ